MQELLSRLGPEQTLLDLGCGSGSIPCDGLACRVIGIDLRIPADIPRPAHGGFARANAASLPLPDRCCDLVVANHTLEHIREWKSALREMGRVLKRGGVLVVAVPDGYCLSDALYRFLDKGREHVNRFQREELAAAVEREAGLRLACWRPLYSSYSFLNRRPWQRFGGRARPLNWLPAPLLRGALLGWNALARAADRRLGARWSVYGWLLRFEAAANASRMPLQEPAATNVCIQCGGSHPAEWLRNTGRVRGRFFARYNCPTCQAFNFFISD